MGGFICWQFVVLQLLTDHVPADTQQLTSCSLMADRSIYWRLFGYRLGTVMQCCIRRAPLRPSMTSWANSVWRATLHPTLTTTKAPYLPMTTYLNRHPLMGFFLLNSLRKRGIKSKCSIVAFLIV